MSFTVHRRFTAPLAILAVAGLALAGCSADGGSGGSGPGDAGEADGVVTVTGTIQDTEADLLEESWADWEAENDIDIQYEGTKEFEAQISTRAQGGTAPDLAIFPQPGLLADLASRDYVQPAPVYYAPPVYVRPATVYIGGGGGYYGGRGYGHGGHHGGHRR